MKTRHLSHLFRIVFCSLILEWGGFQAIAQIEPDYIYQANVMAPMRDGVQLASNIFLPKKGSPFPVILIRTPYGKGGNPFGEARRYTDAGYAMVIQDCRGRGDSEGIWDPFRYDPQDGFDTQEWVGRQAWCNGSIGTAGGSYVGWTQWASAPNASRFLKTMVPIVPFGNPYHQITYPGGAFQIALSLGWGAGVGGIKLPEKDRLDESFRYLPLNRWDDQFDKEVFYLEDWVNHPDYDTYWKERSIDDRYEEITVPILNIGGWYDIFSKATIEMVDQVREKSKKRIARRNQFVVIGPWGHGIGGRRLGELDFGDPARLNVADLQFEWLEYWLKNKETGIQNWSAYRLFLMGENRWINTDQWPLPETRFTKYFLNSSGEAGSNKDNGNLATSALEDQPVDTYFYDPQNPVPTRGGNNLVGIPAGPFDQASLENRKDVLVYSTPPLAEAVKVVGPITATIYAASTAKDTDFTAKLVDVHPDGKAYNLCDGIIRARYRESLTESEPIKPGRVYEYKIDLWVTANMFKAGHRIRLEISSSNFPKYDRNPNSGNRFGTDIKLFPATQTLHHSKEYPSHLLLPIIPN